MPLLPRTLTPEMTTARAVIDILAERYRDAPFLLNPETQQEISYRDFQVRVSMVSRHLCNLGLSKGEKVAFLLENGLFAPQLLLGAMYGGFVPVPVNTVAGASQVAYVLNHSDATVVFVSEEHQAMLSSVIAHIERPLQIIVAHPDRGPDWPQPDTCDTPLPGVDGDDDGLLVYTSGSTGHSKGVLFSQQSLFQNGLNTGSVYQLSPQDRSLCILPLYHMNAIITTLFSTLLSGGSVVIPYQFSVAHFWEWVADYRCTWFALVPTIISHLVNWTSPYTEGKADQLRQIRFVRSSSAPLAPSLHHAFEEKFPLLVVEGMGMTEASTVFMNPPSREQRRIGSPGLPCHETKIVDVHGNTVPPGHAGEILLRGPSIMKGYYKNPEATAEVLSSDGWLRTGDLGYRDVDGYFFIVGRAKEIVIKGGENIAPREIDEALMQHAAVLEAAAVGVPDVYLGEDLVAYVIVKPGTHCSEQELLTHCAQKLGEFKTPTRIYFVEDLPKGPSGKVQRLKLRERHTIAVTTHHIPISRPARHSQQDQQPFECIAPRTPVEEKLVEIWGRVLQRTPIGVHDNFFALGGHSLLAAGILARIRETFQINLPLRVLFEAPTIAALAEHVATARLEDTTPLPLLQSFSHNTVIPLSFAQQRLWILHQLAPESTEYNITTARRFTGPLQHQVFEQSLEEIIRRHASLRTTFPVIDEQPRQAIAPASPFSLTKIDLTALSKAQRDTAVQQHTQEEAQRPFNLAAGPLLRATLLRLTDTEHVFLFSMHHIISDRWSMEVFFWELGMLYSAFVAQHPSPLPALTVQYADLAIWQRQWLHGEVLDQHLTYWRKQLEGAPRLLTLPTDYPRPAVQTHRGAHHRTTFPPSLTDTLYQLSHQEGATLFMTLVAAFQVLLFRYSGQDDIVVGSPTTNRPRVETEQLIGFFINMLVLRTKLSGDPTFRDVLQRVREVALGAYANQAVPFEKLVEELCPERTLNYSPLFQVVFHLRNVPTKAAEFAHLQMEILRVESRTAQFDLTFALCETAHGLEVEVEYATDLFTEATIRRLVDHYRVLLEGIIANPEQPITLLPLVTPTEQHQLLVEWNDTKRDFHITRNISQLFAAQVERTPHAVAIRCEGQQLTYHELHTRANQLAHTLRKCGVGPEVLVGLCVERSLDMMVGLLGILKAGGAYVPLDPSHPTERLALLLDDAQAALLLTQQRLLGQLPQLGSCPVLCLDTDWPQIAQEPTSEPENTITPETLAYVLYTSGSTGQPKGVLGLHQGLLNRLAWMWEAYPFTDGEVCCQKTVLTFVDSIWELLGPLLQGVPLVIIPDHAVKEPPLFVQRLAQHQVTRIVLVPSFLRVLLELFPDLSTRLPQLRMWVTSGEALSDDLARIFHERMPQRTLLNLYGSSEVSADVTWSEVQPPSTKKAVAIGRPIANTQIYLLDAHLQLVPIGVPGEIYVGGMSLARGYLKRPDLTAERFLPHPFSSERDARVYKTGDLGRYRPDGTLEYVGRQDHQVKLRGFRIELGEIEAILQQHAIVRQAVATLREDTLGHPLLVAYVVPKDRENITTGEFSQFLTARVPEYMIPSLWVVLDTLPLNAHGKIDRRALPAPTSNPRATRQFVAPQGTLEIQLAKIWEHVLGRFPIGISDNFFDLGGNSLLVIRAVSHIVHTVKKDLTVATFFQNPTIEQLATHFRQQQWSTPASRFVPLQQQGTLRPFFCISGWVALARFVAPDQPFYMARAFGYDGERAPATIEAIAHEYLKEIRVLQPEGPYFLGGHSYGGLVAFEIAQQLQRQGHTVAFLALLDPSSARLHRAYHAKSSARTEWRYLLSQHLPFSFYHHWAQLRNRNRQQQLHYLWQQVQDKVTSKLKFFVSLAYVQFGHPIPLGLRPDYTANLHVRAITAYRAHPYPGRAVLFQTEQRHPQYQHTWRHLFLHNLDIHHVPGSHLGMFEDDYLQEWAPQFAELLQQAQEQYASAPHSRLSQDLD